MFIALHFPHLSLEVFERTGDQSCEPLAIATHLEILQVNAMAKESGVSAGMRRSTALALSPRLRLLERSTAREQETLGQLACWAAQFTPQVALIPGTAKHAPHSLILEVGSSLRLFGGIQALSLALRSGIQALGFYTSMCCAPTATGAMLLARATKHDTANNPAHESVFPSQARLNNALMQLPIALLNSVQTHLGVLHSMGVSSIKALMQLPRAGLAQRFGRQLLQELDRAFGKQAEAFDWFVVPSSFEVKLELMAQVEHAAALSFAAKRLLVQLSGWLGARQAAVQALHFTALHDDAEPTLITLEFAQATRDVERMTLILRERLEKTRLPEAAHTLILRCPEVQPLAHANAELFLNASTQQETMLKLVERLQARLGREQIVRLELTQDHRPEAAQVMAQFTLGNGNRRTSRQATVPDALELPHGMPRPLWIYPQAIAISERDNRPWFNGPVQLLAGPERIEGTWWASTAGDTGLIERDYFIGLSRDLSMIWLYRSHAWFVQGVFG